MKKSTPIYRITPNEFYTNRYNLFTKIKEEIDRWWIEDQLPNLKDDFAFEALETQNLNVKTLGKISLPVQNLLVIDKNLFGIKNKIRGKYEKGPSKSLL